MKRIALLVAATLTAWASPAIAHKPSKRAARAEALISAEDGTRMCRGSVSSRPPRVRFVSNAGRHVRVVEVSLLDGDLEAFVWVVIVDHSAQTISAVNVASSTGRLCPPNP
jgi:hypothetical protein